MFKTLKIKLFFFQFIKSTMTIRAIDAKVRVEWEFYTKPGAKKDNQK